MNLADSKLKLLISGAGCGVIAAILAFMGNPANMAFCIACFVRDMAGSLGFHSAAPVQYARPEIIGLILGAFIISIVTGEYRSSGGSAPMIRFILGVVIMIGSLIFLGCPLRQLILAGQGSSDSAVTVLGLFFGAGLCHNLGLASSGTAVNPETKEIVAGAVTANGKVACIICIVVCFAIAFLNCKKQESA